MQIKRDSQPTIRELVSTHPLLDWLHSYLVKYRIHYLCLMAGSCGFIISNQFNPKESNGIEFRKDFQYQYFPSSAATTKNFIYIVKISDKLCQVPEKEYQYSRLQNGVVIGFFKKSKYFYNTLKSTSTSLVHSERDSKVPTCKPIRMTYGY